MQVQDGALAAKRLVSGAVYTESVIFTMGWAEILDHPPCGQLLVLDCMGAVAVDVGAEASATTGHDGGWERCSD